MQKRRAVVSGAGSAAAAQTIERTGIKAAGLPVDVRDRSALFTAVGLAHLPPRET
jgi:hypothetical protein